MRTLSLVRVSAIAALVSTQLWCATNDDDPSPPRDSSTTLDGGGNEASTPAEAAPPAAPSACSAAFCRISLPEIDAIALNGVWARSASDVWVVGSSGFAMRFDGSTWQRVVTGTKQALFAVWGATGGPIWGTSTGHTFFTLDGAGTGGDPGVPSVDGGWAGIVTAISGSSPKDVFAVGAVEDPFAGDNIWRLANTSTGDGGATWVPISPPCESYGAARGCLTLRAVWVESESTQWFAGDEGKIYRTAAGGPDAGTSDAGTGDAGQDGDSPSSRLRLTEMNSSSLRPLNALWGFGTDDVWAVGTQGVIRHWTGGEAWDVVPSPTTEDLRGVWGSRSNDVWAVGDDGTVIHWNGQTWALVPTPFPSNNRPRLYGVSGTDSDVWVVGESALLRSVTTAGGTP